MNVYKTHTAAYAVPATFDQEPADASDAAGEKIEGPSYAERIKTKRSVYIEPAREFLESTDVDHFVETAEVVAKELTGPDGRVNNCLLPYNLTPFHIACLASDNDLLQAAFADPRCLECIDQRTVALSEDRLAVSAGNKEIPAMNHDTALHFALFTGWNEGALAMIDRLVSLGKLEYTVNNTGNSLLNLAACQCSREVVEQLCHHLKKQDGDEKYRSYLFHITDKQSSLLHHAVAQQNDQAVFQYLLDQQLLFGDWTLHDQDMAGKTPLDCIEDKVGGLYVKRLKVDDALVESKRQQGFYNSWERFYLEDCTQRIEPRSWVPPWERCVIV